MGAAIKIQLVIDDDQLVLAQSTAPNGCGVIDIDEIILGIDAIGMIIFGEQGSRRKIQYLVKTSRLPVFQVGDVLCARKSALIRWSAGL